MKEVSLSIKSVETNEAVEHWHFKIKIMRTNSGLKRSQRTAAKVGIGRVIKKILTFVATMPDLNCFAYSSLSYEDGGAMPMPAGWQLGILDVIPDSRGCGFNPFETDVHEVQTAVEYTEAEADPSHMQLIDPDSDASDVFDAPDQGSPTNRSVSNGSSTHGSPNSA